MDKSTLRKIVFNNVSFVLPPYDEIVGMDGFGAVCAISELLGGASVYIPSLKTIFKHCLAEAAKEEFNGANFRDIMKKYGYSESRLRNILRA